LKLVVPSKDTSTSNSSEDIGTSSLEERGNTLLRVDYGHGLERASIFDSLTRGHHHPSSNSVQGIRGKTSSNRDTPSEKERNTKVVLILFGKKRLQGIIETKVKASVDDNSNTRDDETAIKSGNTVSSQGLLVDVQKSVELSGTSFLGGFVIVGETSSGVIKRVHEQKR